MAKRAAHTPIDGISLVQRRGETLHRQIYLALLDAITSGQLPAGSRMPSTRALSRTLGVSRNSVLHAFEQLHARGYVEPRVGSGTRVAGKIPRRTLSPAPSTSEPRQPNHKLARLISRSGYPVEQRRLEDSDGNGIYLYESGALSLES